MKTFLIALAFVGANAMACPDGAKDALAPSTDKPVVAVVKVQPAAPLRASTKAVTKVAVKPSADVRKTASL
ncbi:hypothetical protein BH11PSE8_BH11PSE8_28670 [soil metagenome]